MICIKNDKDVNGGKSRNKKGSGEKHLQLKLFYSCYEMNVAIILNRKNSCNHCHIYNMELFFCEGSKCFSKDVMEKLVLVLANLFGRRYLPAKFQDVNIKFYQSKVKSSDKID